MAALDKLLQWAPSQSALARELGVSPQAIEGWRRRGQVPAERVLDIERITAGAVSRYDLRPDIYGAMPLGDRREGDRRQGERREMDRREAERRP
ncbi:transcriptional regulator [Marinobacter sp.]|uniref:transcriptional regulator n=1 Tax=Marinobacter sp. TaxID=50741 RepID=UPI003A908948